MRSRTLFPDTPNPGDALSTDAVQVDLVTLNLEVEQLYTTILLQKIAITL